MRRIAPLFLSLLLIVGGCQASDTTGVATPTTAQPTITTAPATTTTVPPRASVTASDAPGDLASEIEALYQAVIGNAASPEAPPGLLQHLTPTAPPASLTIDTAITTGMVLETHVAVATWVDDLVLAVSDDGSDWRIVGARLTSLGFGPWYGEEPHQILVIGSDARTHEDPLRLRADSLHIVSIGADGTTASIVGIPRDSWVETSYGRTTKFTNVMSGRGPEVVVETAELTTGIDLDGYVVTGFGGFMALIDEFGAFEIDIPFAMNEPKSGAYFAAGRQLVDGAQALAFARNRTLSGGDFTRSFHHGVIMQWGLSAAQGKGPSALPSDLGILTRHVYTDLDAETLLQIAAATFEFDPFEIPNLVVPGTAGRAGEASVVFLDDGAFAIFADLTDGVLDEVPAN
ncbi:MAG: LCP family protein [Acidimicrobiia bacterium]|nr:LCP family protein [Acidimicrobiia bacterium]